MINPKAIKEFTARKMQDHRPMKKLSRKLLVRMIKSKFPTTTFVKPRPWVHQLVTYFLCMKYPAFMNLLDMGLGKTRVLLDVFYNRKKLNQVKRMLVLVPGASNVDTWVEECAKHTPRMSAAGLEKGLSKEKRQAIVWERDDLDVVIMTYVGFMSMVCERVEQVDKQKKKTGKKEMVKVNRLINQMGKRFDMFVLDESTMIRNSKSEMYKCVRAFCKLVEYRYALTGTPFGKNAEHLWSQFFVIDQGETFGTTLGMFRSVFFTEHPHPYKYAEYKFRPDREDLLHRWLQHRSIRYKEEECQDLPDLVETNVWVTLPDSTWYYYDRIITELKAAKGNFRVVENAYINMRQCTSGFLGYKDPEGVKHDIVFKENPKIDLLLQMLEEVPPERQVIIFNEYQRTGDIICKALKKAKISNVRVYGKTTSPKKELDKFRKSKTARVLVLQNASGSMGLNLQNANYMFFYELPADPLVWLQAKKRAHRGGQKRRVFVYNILVVDSVDEKIIVSVTNGENFLTKVVDGKDTTWADRKRKTRLVNMEKSE